MENKENKFIRKIIGGISAGIILAATLIGASFGFKNNINDVNSLDNAYNDILRIETDVEIENGGSIEGASNSIQETLDFLGIQETNIWTVSDDKLIIDVPVSSYSDEDNEDSNVEMMDDLINNSSYKSEAENLIISLLFNGTLDFRSINGDPVFVQEDGVWKFDEETMDSSISEDGSVPTESSKDIDWDVDAKDFYDEAKLTHYNGSPVIEIKISEKGNNSDEYINAFKDFNDWIVENQYTDTTYVAWFNYDLIADILTELGLSETPYDYIITENNTLLRPLYLTASNEKIMNSQYDDTIQITGNFTEKEAKYFVNKINSSLYYNYSNINVNLIINVKNRVMLIVLASLLISFILIVIFSMVSYFGLLGLISASVFTLTNLSFISIFVYSGMLFSGISFLAISIVILISAFIIYIVTKNYSRENNEKYLSTTNIAFKKFSKVNSILISPIVSSVVIFYLSGLVLTTIISIQLYLIVIGIVLSYIFAMVILFPLIYLFDLIVNFTKLENDKKYDILIGFNFKFENKFNNQLSGIKKKNIILIMTGVFMLLASCVVGATLFSTTGSAINTNIYNNESYVYKIMPTENIKLSIDNDQINSDIEADYSSTVFEETKNSMNDIEKEIEDAGVSVYKMEIIRNDHLLINEDSQSSSEDETINDKTYIESEFGFEFYSKTKINSNDVENINNNLSKIQTNYDTNNGVKSTNWKIVESYSWNGNDSFKIINYTENYMFNKLLISLLIITFITSLILLFVGNWGVGLSGLISTILEIIIGFTPLIILFLPYNYFVSLPIIILAISSSTVKILISKKAKNDEIKKENWQRASKESVFIIPILSLLILICELLIIPVYGFITILPMIISTVLFTISIFIIQQYIFTFLSDMFGGFRDKLKDDKLKDDIKRSKDKDIVSEEFIEGVNM